MSENEEENMEKAPETPEVEEEAVVQDAESQAAPSSSTAKTTSLNARSFTVELKLQVVDFAKKNSNSAASKHFKVDRSNIIRWRRAETRLLEMKE